MCYPNDLDAAPGSAGRPFSPEALASWRNICHQEVLCAVNRRDSWYYNFHQHAAGRAPDGHSYEVVARQQSPPFAAYAAKAPGAAHILARSSLATPLASFASTLVAETSREEREMSAHLFGEHFLDARIIQVSETPDLTKGGDPFHFVGVKYLALNSPAKLVKPRDYVYFEYTGSLIDANGEPVVFKVVRSMPLETIEFDCVAARALRHSSTPSQPLVRAELSCLFLFRGTDGGARTEVTVQSLHCFGGKVPSWATAKMLQPFWGGVLNMGTLSAACALQRHLHHGQSKPLLTKKMNSSPRSAAHRAPTCRVCFRGKRLLPSTRVCLGCDQEVCKACTLRLHFLSGDDNDTVALRFCLNCVADARAVGRCSVDAVLLQTPQHQYLSDRQVTPASRSVPSSVLMM